MLVARIIPENGASFLATFESEGVIGKHPSNHLILYGEEVALTHARIWNEGDKWKLSDLNTTSGTICNGRPVRENLALKPGAVVEIGKNRIKVEKISENKTHGAIRAEMSDLSQKINYAKKRVFHEIHLVLEKEKRLSAEAVRSHVTAAFKQAFGVSREEDLPAQHIGMVDELEHELLGLGPLEALLADPQISEIMVNGSTEIFLEREGRLEKSEAAFSSQEAIRSIVDRILLPYGYSLNEQKPVVQVKLADGSRFHAVVPPVSQSGIIVTIRKFKKQLFDLEALFERGFMAKSALEFLKRAVVDRRNMFICGATGSGKTTLLNALLGLVCRQERLVILEDHAEIAVEGPHVIKLEARGTLSVRDLLYEALRMRPDRIIVGECRGTETCEMIQAMNTGHMGSMTTLHANSPRDMMSRLIALLSQCMVNMDHGGLIRQIGTAVDIVIQLDGRRDRKRQIRSVDEVRGLEGQTFILNTVYEAP